MLGALLGLALVGLARILPDPSVGTSNGSVSAEMIARGAWTVRLGLIGQGVFLLGLAVFASRWRARIAADHSPLWRLDARPPQPPRKHDALMLGALLAVAFLLRCIQLNSCLWYDEVVTVTECVRLPYTELAWSYPDQNQHPLYSLSARAAVLAFGESPWALRLPAVLFGVAGLAVFYRFATRIRVDSNWPEPFLATCLLAVSYHHVLFSQNARGYTELLFWTLLGSAMFLENLGRARFWPWVLYAAVMALALFTHLTAAFVLAAHGCIYLFLVARKLLKKERLDKLDLLPLGGLFLTALLAFQLYAPLLPQVLASFQSQTGGVRVEPWTDPRWGLRQIVGGSQIGSGIALAGAAGALVLTVGLVSWTRRRPMIVGVFTLPCVFGLAVMLLLHRHMYPRFFFNVIPLVALLVFRGTFVLSSWVVGVLGPRVNREHWAWRVGVASAAMMLAVSAASLALCYQYPKQDYLGAMAYIREVRQGDDPVVTAGMAAIPIGRIYGPEVEVVGSARQLEQVRARHAERPTWLIYTFPDHLWAYHEDIAQSVSKEFTEVRRFPGTIGGGAVIVCRAEPMTASAMYASRAGSVGSSQAELSRVQLLRPN
jgi:hypothetical protein